MFPFQLSQQQQTVVEQPANSAIFLEGFAGTGKTTTAIARILSMLDNEVHADSFLILIPQRSLAIPYHAALHSPTRSAGGEPTIVTLGGLARRMIELFWPLIAEEAGFANPAQSPQFLTLETAQYFMAQVVRPLIDEERFFEAVSLQRNRLYSQILDNLNKAAVVGFSHEEIGMRLQSAWVGDSGQAIMYEQAQVCASLFRKACLERNLLDFSLQVELFRKHLWSQPLFVRYRQTRFRNLIVDNIEEDTPVTHDLLSEWIPELESSLLIFDTGGGYRRFLGADPQHAGSLRASCRAHYQFSDSFVTSPHIRAFSTHLSQQLQNTRAEITTDIRPAIRFEYHRYQPQMLAWVVDEISSLLNEANLPPGEIAVLAPFMSDALRFSLMELLQKKNIPARSHRPSRALRDEPASQCLITLATLAHPQWGIEPGLFEVAHALTTAIDDLDLVRAHLFAKILFRKRDASPFLEPFDQLRGEMQARLTFTLGERFDSLRSWLATYEAGKVLELDYFLSRLFGELLSQPGYGFHRHYEHGIVTANLIESVKKFRRVIERDPALSKEDVGLAYIHMVKEGVIASQYLRDWLLPSDDSVLLAPAFTFLMTNRPVDYQFWLDVGSSGWWERLYQPLTHPYVLGRGWPAGKPWTDLEEFNTRRDTLHTLTQGLIHRCRRGIILGLSELGEAGYEQRGPLLRMLQRLLIETQPETGR